MRLVTTSISRIPVAFIGFSDQEQDRISELIKPALNVYLDNYAVAIGILRLFEANNINDIICHVSNYVSLTKIGGI